MLKKGESLHYGALQQHGLPHVHNGALQLKQQHLQGWPSHLNHISNVVVVVALPQVHSGALLLKQQAMLLKC